MAVQIVRNVTSDVSEKPGAERYQFTLNGTRYSIDLLPSEWNDFLAGRNDMTVPKFTTLGRVLSTKSEGDENDENGEATTKSEGQAIREWGKANGFSVQDKGKLPKELKEAYAKAMAEQNDEEKADA